MADWGLQAIIKPKQYDDDHHELFGSIDMKKEYDQPLLFCFPQLFDRGGATTSNTMETIVITDELDQLYKPFYRIRPSLLPAANSDDVQNTHHCNHDLDQEIQQDQEHEIKNTSGSDSNTFQVAPKLKKRKNQQKRVVVQVTADGLSADPWAWRKYGQKPIKGSIYPRSYYRCSSSKGCIARRQVEQSCTDSSIYILTYTADHNHPQPTRRNSLAGINRTRFKATPKSPTSGDGGKTVTMSKDSPFHSPATLSVSSTEDEVVQQANNKQESEETLLHNKLDDKEHTMMPGINDEDYMVFSDDFFEGLEDLEGQKIDSSSHNSSTRQFHVFC